MHYKHLKVKNLDSQGKYSLAKNKTISLHSSVSNAIDILKSLHQVHSPISPKSH